jgi:hypothetical protein
MLNTPEQLEVGRVVREWVIPCTSACYQLSLCIVLAGPSGAVQLDVLLPISTKLVVDGTRQIKSVGKVAYHTELAPFVLALELYLVVCVCRGENR